MLDWIFDRFKDPDDLKFKSYMKYLKQDGDPDLYEEALDYETSVPALLIEHYPMLTFKEIDNMTWREVQFRINHIGKKINSNLDAIEKIVQEAKKGVKTSYHPLDRYQYSLVKDNR